MMILVASNVPSWCRFNSLTRVLWPFIGLLAVVAPLASGGSVDEDHSSGAHSLAHSPFNLSHWASYFGGSGSEIGESVILAPDGSIILGGDTSSPDLSSTPGTYDETHNGDWDVFLARISSDGRVLIASTYLGGSGEDHLTSLTTDAQGRILITGTTRSSDFPTTSLAYDRTLDGPWDVFLASMDSNLTMLDFGTYLGGSSEESVGGVAVMASGEVVLVGATESADFPTSSNPGTALQGYRSMRSRAWSSWVGLTRMISQRV